MDHRWRSAFRCLRYRHPTLRALPCKSPPSRRPHRRVAGATLRNALAARRAENGAAAAKVAALRSVESETCGVRNKGQLGTRELLLARGRERTCLYLWRAGLAALRARRAARVPRGRRGFRSNVVREIHAQGARRVTCSSTPLRQ